MTTPLVPGESQVLVGGVPQNVTTGVSPEGESVVVQGEDFAVTLSPTDASGAPLPVTPNGELLLPPASVLAAQAEGFGADSAVHVYWHSGQAAATRTPRQAVDTTLLSEGRADAAGSFGQPVSIPDSVPPGPGVMQIVGQLPGGADLVINVAMTIAADQPVPTIDVKAKRGTGPQRTVITVRGTTTGLSTTEAKVSIRIGRGRSADVKQATVAIRADGTFTWSMRTRASVRIVVTAGGATSAPVVISAVRTRP